MRLKISLLALVTMLLVGNARPVAANDYILTIGGGPHPSGNQISLENNVLYFQRTLGKLGLDNVEHQILFADGNDEIRDIQYMAREKGGEDLKSLLAEVIGPGNGFQFNYRSNSIPGVNGPAEPAVIEETLEQFAKRLTKDDRLVIYFTGHGGRPRPGTQPRARRSRGEPTPAKKEDEAAAETKAEEKTEAKTEEAAKPDAVATEPVKVEAPPKEEAAPETPPTPETEAEDPGTEDATTPKDPVNCDDEKKEEPKAESKPAKEEAKQPAKDKPKPLTDSDNFTHLWPNEEMSVKEWTEFLDQFPADTEVVAVMVQCYSGGFGNMIFQGGDPANGLAEQPRCGFFSTVPDRVAAGCTPNIDQAEYREYSSYFWEALSGETRTGSAVSQPDYNNDGQTSMLEAHAYTVLTADTIDIPIRTSDTLLRHFSKTSGQEGLLTIHAPLAVLMTGADSCEKAVIEGLAGQFDLKQPALGKVTEELIKTKQEEKKKLDKDLGEARKKIIEAKMAINKDVRNKWPELASPWHPDLDAILKEDGEKMRETIMQHGKYSQLRDAEKAMEEAQGKAERLDLDVVKLERLKYWLETRALVLNLTVCTDAKTIDAYHKLVALESETFSSDTKSPAPQATPKQTAQN
ncbi:hypothetical protein [Bremerella cremea]|uniref:hypothetical protein n=1 Tax=Bremerella cremea TaxID=1031537 RepID=UPI0031F0CF07